HRDLGLRPARLRPGARTGRVRGREPDQRRPAHHRRPGPRRTAGRPDRGGGREHGRLLDHRRLRFRRAARRRPADPAGAGGLGLVQPERLQPRGALGRRPPDGGQASRAASVRPVPRLRPLSERSGRPLLRRRRRRHLGRGHRRSAQGHRIRSGPEGRPGSLGRSQPGHRRGRVPLEPGRRASPVQSGRHDGSDRRHSGRGPRRRLSGREAAQGRRQADHHRRQPGQPGSRGRQDRRRDRGSFCLAGSVRPACAGAVARGRLHGSFEEVRHRTPGRHPWGGRGGGRRPGRSHAARGAGAGRLALFQPRPARSLGDQRRPEPGGHQIFLQGRRLDPLRQPRRSRHRAPDAGGQGARDLGQRRLRTLRQSVGAGPDRVPAEPERTARAAGRAGAHHHVDARHRLGPRPHHHAPARDVPGGRHRSDRRRGRGSVGPRPDDRSGARHPQRRGVVRAQPEAGQGHGDGSGQPHPGCGLRRDRLHLRHRRRRQGLDRGADAGPHQGYRRGRRRRRGRARPGRPLDLDERQPVAGNDRSGRWRDRDGQHSRRRRSGRQPDRLDPRREHRDDQLRNLQHHHHDGEGAGRGQETVRLGRGRRQIHPGCRRQGRADLRRPHRRGSSADQGPGRRRRRHRRGAGRQAGSRQRPLQPRTLRRAGRGTGIVAVRLRQERHHARGRTAGPAGHRPAADLLRPASAAEDRIGSGACGRARPGRRRRHSRHGVGHPARRRNPAGRRAHAGRSQRYGATHRHRPHRGSGEGLRNPRRSCAPGCMKPDGGAAGFKRRGGRRRQEADGARKGGRRSSVSGRRAHGPMAAARRRGDQGSLPGHGGAGQRHRRRGRRGAGRIRLRHRRLGLADGLLRADAASAGLLHAFRPGRGPDGGDPRSRRPHHVGQARQCERGRARQLSEERIPADGRGGPVQDQAGPRLARADGPARGLRPGMCPADAAHGAGAARHPRQDRTDPAQRVHVQPGAHLRPPDRGPLHRRAGGTQPRRGRAYPRPDVRVRGSVAPRSWRGADPAAQRREGPAGPGPEGRVRLPARNVLLQHVRARLEDHARRHGIHGACPPQGRRQRPDGHGPGAHVGRPAAEAEQGLCAGAGPQGWRGDRHLRQQPSGGARRGRRRRGSSGPDEARLRPGRGRGPGRPGAAGGPPAGAERGRGPARRRPVHRGADGVPGGDRPARRGRGAPPRVRRTGAGRRPCDRFGRLRTLPAPPAGGRPRGPGAGDGRHAAPAGPRLGSGRRRPRPDRGPVRPGGFLGTGVHRPEPGRRGRREVRRRPGARLRRAGQHLGRAGQGQHVGGPTAEAEQGLGAGAGPQGRRGHRHFRQQPPGGARRGRRRRGPPGRDHDGNHQDRGQGRLIGRLQLAPCGQGLHQRQLRRHPRQPAGIRAVRPREGRLHRRGGPAHRQVRGGQRRHAVSRRNRRDGRPPSGQAAARHSGAGDRPRRRLQAGARQHPHHRHLQPRPGQGRGRGDVPRRPAVPPERGEPAPAAAARTPRRHRRAGRPLRQEIRRGQRRGPGRRRRDPQLRRPDRGRDGEDPDPGHAQPLPGQPHPCGDHPGHLDPHPAQQAERIRRPGTPIPAPQRLHARDGASDARARRHRPGPVGAGGPARRAPGRLGPDRGQARRLARRRAVPLLLDVQDVSGRRDPAARSGRAGAAGPGDPGDAGRHDRPRPGDGAGGWFDPDHRAVDEGRGRNASGPAAGHLPGVQRADPDDGRDDEAAAGLRHLSHGAAGLDPVPAGAEPGLDAADPQQRPGRPRQRRPDHPGLRRADDGWQLHHRGDHLRHPAGGELRGHHQGCDPYRRGVGPLHPGLHAGQADGHRRRSVGGPDQRGPGQAAPQGAGAGIDLLRGHGRRLEIRARRRRGGSDHHLHQRHRRPADRGGAARHARHGGGQHLCPADRRRRPCDADPGHHRVGGCGLPGDQGRRR
uniref:Acetyl-CoA C-acyltransferase n=1 Tax=Parastrongyloides trichosuri TaxID=131310 RepID=A0A0N5A038_PARTI